MLDIVLLFSSSNAGCFTLDFRKPNTNALFISFQEHVSIAPRWDPQSVFLILIPCHVCFQKKPDWALEKDGKAKAGGDSEDLAKSENDASATDADNNTNAATVNEGDKNDSPPENNTDNPPEARWCSLIYLRLHAIALFIYPLCTYHY